MSESIPTTWKGFLTFMFLELAQVRRNGFSINKKYSMMQEVLSEIKGALD